MKKYKSVAEFLADIDHDKKAQVEALRAIIFETEPALTEHIKWNSPSYVSDDEDRITFNLHNKPQVVRLVLHMGATRTENKKGSPVMEDKTGLITWNSDIRGMLSFGNLEEIESHRGSISKIIQNWLAIK